MYRAMGKPFVQGSYNWFAYMNGSVLYYSYSSIYRYEDTYFGSREACENAVATIGKDNFTRYVLGVEPDA